MSFRHVRSLVLNAAVVFLPAVIAAQVPSTRPTPEQAAVLLKTRPDLVIQLRQRFATSGLTREQVHARLRTEGYPEDLLDAYLPGFAGEAAPPSDDVFRAVRALGISDADELALLRNSGLRSRDSLDTTSDTLERNSAERDSGFVIFGLDVFRGATSQFEANLSGPVDANYRLGPGDRLVLIITGDVQASYQLDVTREGFVVIPQVGQISVASLTMGQLNTLLRSQLARSFSGVAEGRTRFSVSVANLRANQVYVVGDVRRPGSYVVSSAGTALSALYAAGGPTVNGSFRTVEVRRAGRAVDVLDVYDYLIRGDATHDVRLETGDVIFVPIHQSRVRIVGEIARPATYEVKPGETLGNLLRNAGGFKATAARQRVLIERIVPPSERREGGWDRITLDASTDGLLAGSGTGITLQNGDVVRVLAITDKVRNRIVVMGNVFQPGAQGLTAGMRLSDALRKAGGLQPDTYLGEALVTRLRADGAEVQLRATLADSTGRVLNDFALTENDQIQVFSLADFRPERYVAIGGAVREGGRFSYREGMTLRDLVLLAKGVTEGAELNEAEIARLPSNRTEGRTAQSLRVALDSTYLFERGPNGEYIGPPGLAFAASGAPEVKLLPYDNVLIFRQPGWELQRVVSVRGEVRYPGNYALLKKSERLSDVIARAGGLTAEAYAAGVVFTRGQDSIGRVGVDLPSALRRYDGADNLVLQKGDVIDVPSLNPVVTIRGAVNAPTTVAHSPGKDIDYYINAAGGPSRTADRGRAYVMQPGGKMESVHRRFFGRMTALPEPGPSSVVTVPVKDPDAAKDRLALYSTIAQIVTGGIAVIVAIRR